MNQRFKRIISIFLGALALLFSAYINGFPIVYSDTSTYLASGFELETPFDRPITYGLFLRLASLNGISLWLVIFTQGLLVSFLIFRLFKTLIRRKSNIHFLFLASIIVLSLFTSASWTTSQLIADIFTPILFLSLLLLLIGTSKKGMQIFLYFIFLLATATHISHVSFNIVFIVAILIIRQLNFLSVKDIIKLKPLLICLILTLLSITTMGSALSKSKHGFLMGALVEHGIAKKYLEEYCEEENYTFCEYKDSLPDKGWEFLWNENSPFYKMGGWKGTKEEFNEIIFNTLTEPKYIALHIKESIKATADQLSKFKIGDGNGSFSSGTLLHKRIEKYFGTDINPYNSSLQNQQKLTFLNGYNTVLLFVILGSLIVLFFLILKVRHHDKRLIAAIVIILLGILVNSWACGTLANAIDRLGSKVIWLIPLITLIGVFNSFHISDAKKTHKF